MVFTTITQASLLSPSMAMVGPSKVVEPLTPPPSPSRSFVPISEGSVHQQVRVVSNRLARLAYSHYGRHQLSTTWVVMWLETIFRSQYGETVTEGALSLVTQALLQIGLRKVAEVRSPEQARILLTIMDLWSVLSSNNLSVSARVEDLAGFDLDHAQLILCDVPSTPVVSGDCRAVRCVERSFSQLDEKVDHLVEGLIEFMLMEHELLEVTVMRERTALINESFRAITMASGVFLDADGVTLAINALSETVKKLCVPAAQRIFRAPTRCDWSKITVQMIKEVNRLVLAFAECHHQVDRRLTRFPSLNESQARSAVYEQLQRDRFIHVAICLNEDDACSVAKEEAFLAQMLRKLQATAFPDGMVKTVLETLSPNQRLVMGPWLSMVDTFFDGVVTAPCAKTLRAWIHRHCTAEAINCRIIRHLRDKYPLLYAETIARLEATASAQETLTRPDLLAKCLVEAVTRHVLTQQTDSGSSSDHVDEDSSDFDFTASVSRWWSLVKASGQSLKQLLVVNPLKWMINYEQLLVDMVLQMFSMLQHPVLVKNLLFSLVTFVSDELEHANYVDTSPSTDKSVFAEVSRTMLAECVGNLLRTMTNPSSSSSPPPPHHEPSRDAGEEGHDLDFFAVELGRWASLSASQALLQSGLGLPGLSVLIADILMRFMSSLLGPYQYAHKAPVCVELVVDRLQRIVSELHQVSERLRPLLGPHVKLSRPAEQFVGRLPAEGLEMLIDAISDWDVKVAFGNLIGQHVQRGTMNQLWKFCERRLKRQCASTGIGSDESSIDASLLLSLFDVSE